jgi:molecular chaperone GrpE
MPKSDTVPPNLPPVDDLEPESDETVPSDDQSSEVQELLARCEALEAQVVQAQERERRALADYNNVLRRSQEQQTRMLRIASLSTWEPLFTPLDHLQLAITQLKDPGLTMIGQQFQHVLRDQGVEELDVLGKPFDEQLMEAIGKEPVADAKKVGIVTKVQRPGYRLHGEVVRPAQVIVGELATGTKQTTQKTEAPSSAEEVVSAKE